MAVFYKLTCDAADAISRGFFLAVRDPGKTREFAEAP